MLCNTAETAGFTTRTAHGEALGKALRASLLVFMLFQGEVSGDKLCGQFYFITIGNRFPAFDTHSW